MIGYVVVAVVAFVAGLYVSYKYAQQVIGSVQAELNQIKLDYKYAEGEAKAHVLKAIQRIGSLL